VGLERGPLSIVNTIEELLERKISGSGLESREYSRRIRCANHVAPSIRKSCHYLRRQAEGLSVGVVGSRTEATEFVLS
jgi:hypothetical protein